MQKFNIYNYIESKYKGIIENYKEDYGLNGWDRLLMCGSEEEVDELLSEYVSE